MKSRCSVVHEVSVIQHKQNLEICYDRVCVGGNTVNLQVCQEDR